MPVGGRPSPVSTNRRSLRYVLASAGVAAGVWILLSLAFEGRANWVGAAVFAVVFVVTTLAWQRYR